jgi:ubiquitin-protein ligase E3 C
MENTQKEKFLSFCTGAERPPLLGFKFLYPTFCIEKLAIEGDKIRYPTSSTCFNMLRLPFYGCTAEGY